LLIFLPSPSPALVFVFSDCPSFSGSSSAISTNSYCTRHATYGTRVRSDCARDTILIAISTASGNRIDASGSYTTIHAQQLRDSISQWGCSWQGSPLTTRPISSPAAMHREGSGGGAGGAVAPLNWTAGGASPLQLN
jgi:hypothetical protein